jgi:hypothetical protein
MHGGEKSSRAKNGHADEDALMGLKVSDTFLPWKIGGAARRRRLALVVPIALCA